MSHTEDNKKTTQEPEASDAALKDKELEASVLEEMLGSPAPSAPSQTKPLKYGNRKARPGAQAPAVTKISSISGALEEVEEIEMDDLPIRATAPKDLIDERPSRNQEENPRGPRPRGERRRREDRERSPETSRASASEDSEETAPEAAEASSEQSDRPERFGMVNDAERKARAAQNVQEFRPSRDGRTTDKNAKTSGHSSAKKGPKKKGFLSWLISLFTGKTDEDQKPQSKTRPDGRQREDRDRNRGNRERGPRNRQQDGERSDDDKGRRPRRRRGPRPEGAEGRSPRPEGSDGDKQSRPRRRRRSGNRRPQGERRENASAAE